MIRSPKETAPAGAGGAWTRSSTRRVETPPIQASWITATKAFSVILRGSRKAGKYEP
jgi:hypothetical protein